MHYCLNITTEKKNQGCAILIRSLIPTHGLDIIKKNRKNKTQLTNGPAKLIQALNIPIDLNNTLINKKSLLITDEKINPKNIITSKRIGITKNKNKPWRFYFNC